ncbi:MAG TPA: DUF4249 family protein [Longimicrobiaceae bacterium]|nr:DUF4249 family protein [Longimicrobiaceae bacterium]
MRRACLALLLLAAGGCELLRPPTDIDAEPRLQLHSVLRAGSDTVAVLIERVGAEAGIVRRAPVSGARVSIAGGGVEAALREAPQGFPSCALRFDAGELATPPIGAGCYAAILPGGVRPGESYSLAVELPDGGSITGRTVVPERPTAVQPAESARVPVQSNAGVGMSGVSHPVTVRWRAPTGGSRVRLVPTPGAVFARGGAIAGAGCQLWPTGSGETYLDGGQSAPLGDSLRFSVQLYCAEPAGTGGGRLVPDSVEVRLDLVAVDSAYARFAETWGDDAVREARASAGVTGAFGVFAGHSLTRRRIVLVFSPP